MMKRIVLSCLGLAAVALSARPGNAADLAPRYAPVAPAPVYYSSLYNWTGFYLGINGGGGWGRSQWDGIDRFDVSGGVIGGTIGYNWQFNRFVIGAEGDIDWSGIKGSTAAFCPFGDCSTRNDWLATVRGRFGYAVFERLLVFGTAGFALGDINAGRFAFPGGSITNIGWTVGAGLEYAVARNVSLKAEYLFVDLGTFNCGFNCGLVGNADVSFYANLLRGGLNIRF